MKVNGNDHGYFPTLREALEFADEKYPEALDGEKIKVEIWEEALQ